MAEKEILKNSGTDHHIWNQVQKNYIPCTILETFSIFEVLIFHENKPNWVLFLENGLEENKNESLEKLEDYFWCMDKKA